MNKYPDYVKKYRPKGTIVKKTRNTYYVYEATSKIVEGKTYPVQVIKGLKGKIDENGFHETTINHVNTENISINEYGFTNYLLKYLKDYIILKASKYKKIDSILVYKSFILYLSPNSYLINDKIVVDIDVLIRDYHVNIAREIKSIEKLIEYDLKVLENLKYICKVYFSNREYYTDLTNEQIKLLNKLGVRQDELK